MRNIPRAIFCCCTILLLAAPCARALPPALSAGEVETQPAATQPELVLPEVEPIRPLPIELVDSVNDALRLTEDEQTVLSDIQDGTASPRGPAMSIMLRRAAMLPVGQKTLDAAEIVPAGNLIDHPEKYRMHLLRYPVRVWRVQKYRGLAVTRWWPRRDVWQFDCTVDAPPSQPSHPLIVLLTSLPEGFAGEGVYDRGPRAIVAGLFYMKVVQRMERPGADEIPFRAHPVLAANTLYQPSSPAEDRGPSGLGGPPVAIIGAVLVLLLLGFYIAKRYARPGPMKVFEMRQQRLHERAAANEESDQPVDPELTRQVEQWRAEHAAGDDSPPGLPPNHNGPKKDL